MSINSEMYKVVLQEFLYDITLRRHVLYKEEFNSYFIKDRETGRTWHWTPYGPAVFNLPNPPFRAVFWPQTWRAKKLYNKLNHELKLQLMVEHYKKKANLDVSAVHAREKAKA